MTEALSDINAHIREKKGYHPNYHYGYHKGACQNKRKGYANC